MNARHAVTISLALGVAAVAGTVAATRTIGLGHPAAAVPAQSSSALIAQRTKQLDRAEAALKKALKRRPPKLPPLPDALPAPAATGSPVSTAAPAPAPTQRVVYVRPAPRVVTVHRSGGEHESESGQEHEGGGGGFDD